MNKCIFATQRFDIFLNPFGPMTRFYFFLSFAGKLLCSSSRGALSDEKTGLICSAICQWSEPRRTRNRTLLSHLRLLVSLSVASYDSQGLWWKYNILTRLHTDILNTALDTESVFIVKRLATRIPNSANKSVFIVKRTNRWILSLSLFKQGHRKLRFEHSTQLTLSRLPAQNTKMYSSKQEPPNNWTTVSNKWGRPTEEESLRAAKLVKESYHWLNPTSTHNHYSALLVYRREGQQQTTDTGKTPKPLWGRYPHTINTRTADSMHFYWHVL
jgi:hypothetical protein